MIELLAPMVCGGVLRDADTHVVLDAATEERIVAAGNAVFVEPALYEFEGEPEADEVPPVPDSEDSRRVKKNALPELLPEQELSQIQFGRGLE